MKISGQVCAVLLGMGTCVSAQTATQAPATPMPQTEQPLHLGSGITPPRILHEAQPKFPPGFKGVKTVELYLWVSAEGLPSHIRVLSSPDPDLNQRAVEALRQYTFTPAMRDGKPVTVELRMEISFQTL